MTITNTSKPTTSYSNTTRVSIEETWDSNTSTWATETRTWDDMASLMDNVSKQSSSITNIAKP